MKDFSSGSVVVSFSYPNQLLIYETFCMTQHVKTQTLMLGGLRAHKNKSPTNIPTPIALRIMWLMEVCHLIQTRVRTGHK